MHIYILPQCSTTAASVLNSAGMDAQFERSCCAISRGILKIPALAKGTTAFVSVSNTCLTARLAIAVFYVPLPTIENVEICWKRRKIGHYRAVQFSEREAVSISPKQ